MKEYSKSFDCGFYNVHVANTHDVEPCCMPLHILADKLPHGAGIDGNWYIQVLKNGNLVLRSEYHVMIDGYYTKWESFSFRIVHEKGCDRCGKIIRMCDVTCADVDLRDYLNGLLYDCVGTIVDTQNERSERIIV